jgi:hypothetical protein
MGGVLEALRIDIDNPSPGALILQVDVVIPQMRFFLKLGASWLSCYADRMVTSKNLIGRELLPQCSQSEAAEVGDIRARRKMEDCLRAEIPGIFKHDYFAGGCSPMSITILVSR